MKNNLDKYSWVGIALLAGIAFKLVTYYSGLPDRWPTFFYLFLILTIVVYSSWSSTAATMINQVKDGIRTSVILVLGFSLFTYCYYEFIDISYFPARIAELEEIKIDDAEKLEQNLVWAKRIFSSFWHATFTLVAFTFSACIYSMILTPFLRQLKK